MVQKIKSWTDLAGLIQDHADGGWIFRGEPGNSNPLRPKSGRVGPGYGTARKKPFDRRDEERALSLFKKEARPYLDYQPSSDMEWLAIAQHHGMATRLLDWTESLLVASYFAVKSAGTRGPAVIYGVKDLAVVSEVQEHQPFEIASVMVYRPPHITPRIPAQRSVFTIHPNPTDEYQSDKLIKWEISHTVCGKIKSILDTCAINESSLFPDLDGLSRHVGWKYKWGKV